MKSYYIKIAENNSNFDEIKNNVLNSKSIGICFKIKNIPLIKGNEDHLKIMCQELIEDDNWNHSFNCYNKFINKMENDDILFLCQGENKILYMCQIDGDYFFDKENRYPHRRKIKNICEFNCTTDKRMIQTIYNVEPL